MSKKINKTLGKVLHSLEDVTHVVRGIRSVLKLVAKLNGSGEDEDEEEDEE